MIRKKQPFMVILSVLLLTLLTCYNSHECIDNDLDGYCVESDCDDTVAACNIDCITDIDYDYRRDCDDTCIDIDRDGYGRGPTCLGLDVNDTNPNCDISSTDNDNDQYCINHDCNDNERNCTIDCSDINNNGIPDCVELRESECNSQDDDSDGFVDEDWECAMYIVSSTCYNSCGGRGFGFCGEGCSLISCKWFEICNTNIDEDCDGHIDEIDCEYEWIVGDFTFSDLNLSCNGRCDLYDYGYNYSIGSQDCDTDNECIYLSTGDTGFCGVIWVSRQFVVPSNAPILQFDFKTSGGFWASRRGVVIEILDEQRSHFIKVVECERGSYAFNCTSIDNAGPNDTWTTHTVDLSRYSGREIQFTLYLYDLSPEWCDMPDHPIEVWIRNVFFTN